MERMHLPRMSVWNNVSFMAPKLAANLGLWIALQLLGRRTGRVRKTCDEKSQTTVLKAACWPGAGRKPHHVNFQPWSSPCSWVQDVLAKKGSWTAKHRSSGQEDPGPGGLKSPQASSFLVPKAFHGTNKPGKSGTNQSIKNRLFWPPREG